MTQTMQLGYQGQGMQGKQEKWHYIWRSLLACLLLLALGCTSLAQAQVVGVITHMSGVTTARHPDGSVRIMAVKSEVLQGDTLITQANTYTRVKFLDNAEIVLRPASELVVSSYLYDDEKPEKDNVIIGLIKGGLRAVTGLVGKRNRDAVNFNTPTATIGIRGTHFGALYCQGDCAGLTNPSGAPLPDGLHVDVTQGAIIVSDRGGSQIFNAGQFGYVRNSNSPPVIVPVEQSHTVTMPAAISKNVNSGTTIGTEKVNACLAQ